jgi:hypothetical protein
LLNPNNAHLLTEKLDRGITLYGEHEGDIVNEQTDSFEDTASLGRGGTSMKHFSTHDLSRANELLVKQKVKLGLTHKIEKDLDEIQLFD